MIANLTTDFKKSQFCLMYYLDLCEAATDALLLLVTNSRGKVYFRDSSVVLGVQVYKTGQFSLV